MESQGTLIAGNDHARSRRADRTGTTTSVWRLAGLGAAGGLLWGVAMRLWMRLISTSPEFSWSGTAMILVIAVVAGTLLGVAEARRRAHGRGWWRLNGLAVLGLGGGAGIVMLPSVLLGAVAFGRTSWNRWARAALGMAGAGIQIGFFVVEPLGGLPSWRVITGLIAYAILITSEALAASVVFRPASGPPGPGRTADAVTTGPMAEGKTSVALPGTG